MQVCSLTNPLVKHLVRLASNPSYRKRSGSFLVVGTKMVKEALERLNVTVVVASDQALLPKGVKGCLVTPAILKKISNQTNPEGIVAEVAFKPAQLHGTERYLLVLDGVQDPGNVGSLMRTAVALGWEAVILLDNCADPINPKALSASKGAIFRIPFVTMTAEELKKLPLPLVAASLEGEPFAKKGPCALILGSEGQGLSQAVKALKPQLITIPLMGDMESLNVAAAGAILLQGLK